MFDSCEEGGEGLVRADEVVELSGHGVELEENPVMAEKNPKNADDAEGEDRAEHGRPFSVRPAA